MNKKTSSELTWKMFFFLGRPQGLAMRRGGGAAATPALSQCQIVAAWVAILPPYSYFAPINKKPCLFAPFFLRPHPFLNKKCPALRRCRAGRFYFRCFRASRRLSGANLSPFLATKSRTQSGATRAYWRSAQPIAF